MGTYMSQQHYQSLLNTTITQEENNATTAASAAVVTTRSNRFAQQASALARLKRRLITAKRRCQATKAVGKEQQHHSAATPPPYAAAVVEPNNDSVTDDANMLMKLQAITAKCQLYATISKPDYIREHEKQTKRTIAALSGLVSAAELKLAHFVKDEPGMAASDDETTKVFRRVDGEWQEQEHISEDGLKADLERLRQGLQRQKVLAEMDAAMTADALKEDITRCQAWVQNKLQAAQNDELQALIITNELIDATLGDPEDEMEEGLRARVQAEVQRQQNEDIANVAGAACCGISCYAITLAVALGICL